MLSPRLCDTVDDWSVKFAAVGTSARVFFRDVGIFLEGISDIVKALDGISVLGIGTKLLSALRDTADHFHNFFKWIRLSLGGWCGVFSGARADTLCGLYFTRAVLQLFKGAGVGWGFIVQAEFSFSVEFTQIERIVNYLIEYLYPTNVPHQADVDRMFVTGEIGEPLAQCLTELNGNQWRAQKAIQRSQRVQPSPLQLVQHWLKYRTPEAALDDAMARAGVLDVRDREILKRSLAFLPPPSDAIRFAIRDVFDPNKLGRKEMEAELRQQVGLVELFRAQGIDKITLVGSDRKPFVVDVPLLYWLASYEEVSPTQVFEMLHRLRPKRVARLALPGAGGGVVVPDPVEIPTVRSLLKEKDYNPIWRDRLAAISYRVPGRIDVKRMYQVGIFGKPEGKAGFRRKPGEKIEAFRPAELELVERYLDLGFGPSDANEYAFWTATEIDRQTAAKGRLRSLSAACKAFGLGAINEAGALDRFTEITGDKVEAGRLVAVCKAEHANWMLSDALLGVRKRFLKGESDERETRFLLTQIGVVKERADEHIRTWKLHLMRTVKEATASQLLDWLAAGLIDRKEVERRLVNIGFPADDAKRAIRFRELGELAKGRKEAERLARQRQAALDRLAKGEEKIQRDRAKRANEELVRRLGLRSEKNLKQWWSQGLITRDEVAEAFRLKGRGEEDIQRWLEANEPKGGDDGSEP